ncbi:adenylyl-sulfate kinase [Paraburkholderia hospita]|uniref:adenylyl-sulfate kinase n=1 Tax=Paraburkholderia hospita TaxID=169430 RepID=UPI00117800B2|nr:adenylyl-sulfate kinase [Paraburkholderia hospita]
MAKPSAVSKFDRARLKQHPAFVVWLTGLSGAGKSTLANLLEQNLYSRGLHTCLLDGDNLRLGLNKDLGFSEADRHENVRRVAEVAKLMVDAGNIVITAAISPFRSSRESARALFEPGEFIEVFVDVPLDVAEARDPKGLYALARQGEIKQFTGIGSGYEAPLAPDVHLSTATSTPEESLSALMRKLPLSNMPGQFINPMTTRVPLGSKETVCDTFRPPIVGI